ncbi:MAG: hypothetical protein EA422_09060 [Gemmatimonadales bacterium]|nr:MAG: hypothetical protein EA422_09060 [Gemmatimonadales bacterium]
MMNSFSVRPFLFAVALASMVAAGCGTSGMGASGEGASSVPPASPAGVDPAGHEVGAPRVGELAGPSWGALPGTEDAHCFPVDRLPAPLQARADTVLARALDNEALFTLWEPLKPMSSVHLQRTSLARVGAREGDRDQVSADHPDLEALRELQEVVRHLHCGALTLTVIPYRATQDSTRSVQVTVVHRGRMDQVLERDLPFWGQWGLVPGASPHTVGTVVEFEAPLDRFRGYGYLFGYPEHAVTFFTEAGREMQETGEFVDRDFFQIPVHSSESGRFVYAVPPGHEPLPEDEAIRSEAARILEVYRAWRPRFENDDGTLRAVEMLRAWFEDGGGGVDPGRP